MNSVTFTQPALARLFSKANLTEEVAAICLAGSAQSRDGGVRILVRDIHVMELPDVIESTPAGVIISPVAIARIMKTARQQSLHLAFMHSHTQSGEVRLSAKDLIAEKTIMPSVFARAAGPHANLVFNRNACSGKVFTAPSTGHKVDAIFSLGEKLQRVAHAERAVSSERFDRNARALGAQGQAIIETLRVGVVGLGGTGSVVAQQLAYLGVRDFLLVDCDSIEASNLNRTVTARHIDVGQPKVIAARNALAAINPMSDITPVHSDVLDKQAALALRSCDFIFACTDSHGSRALLNQIAYQYYVPTIDVGVQISVSKTEKSTLGGRIQYLAPGFACLACTGLLDSTAVRFDFMTEEQRQRDPYFRGATVPQPSVVSLNSTIASLAVTMFLSVVAGLDAPARYLIYRAELAQLRRISASPRHTCPICSKEGASGRGDSFALPFRA